MAQKIKQADIFGRIGSGIGKGLSESLPKEIERGRLAEGLKNLGEQQNLTPFQQFSSLASTPGVTPQMLQTGGDLLRQQAYLNALKNQYQGREIENQGATNRGYIPTQEEVNTSLKGEVPTLSTAGATEQSYKTYIPPSEQQERNDAYENFNANPARYNYDFNNAIQERKAITARNQEIQKAYQTQESTAVAKEEQLKGALDKEVKRLGLNNVPPKVFQKFEKELLNSILPKKEGGKGWTQEQAVKNISEQMEQANRNYLDLSSLSAWSPDDFNRRVDSLQKDFASRGEQQSMMDQLTSNYQVSPLYAAHKAYTISPKEKKVLNEIPRYMHGITGVVPSKVNESVYDQLKDSMGDSGSPLAIAYELQQKGIDPRDWLKYLDDNRKDLKGWQADQLSKNLNVIDLKDMWLQAWE